MTIPARFRLAPVHAVLLFCVLLASPCAMATQATGQDRPLLVFAAASLKNAMDGVVEAYGAHHAGADVKVSYAGSSTLARQIEAGAPADVYVSANRQWMDRLAADGLIDRTTRRDLLGNTLVLVAPRNSSAMIHLAKGVDLRAALGANGYLAMANTDAVPAGIYGRHALQYLGIWPRLEGHIAQGDDVRAALALVSRGEAPLGVVYASDAVADHGVRVVDIFPPASHRPIVYPAAATADSHNPADAEFLAFLQSDAAARIFRRWGFRVLGGSPAAG